jgi:hypothetical protein
VQTVDYAATAASVAIGAGTATLAIRELVKKLGVRKAGEILAREFIKNQTKLELQDKAIEGLAQALGADPATAKVVHEAMPLTMKRHHAEAKILWAAEVDEIGATRAICQDCRSLLGQFWTQPIAPLK